MNLLRWIEFKSLKNPRTRRSFTLLYVLFHLPCLAESQAGGWGRPSPCRGKDGGAGVLVALWNRLHVFVGEPEPLVPYVRHSNR
jgi:hypothetical protein